VFGARGSANFLSKSTAVLATVFFAISLGMAMYASRSANVAPAADDLGVMGRMAPASEVPAATDAAAPEGAAATEVPAAETPTIEVPAADSAAATESTKVEEKKEGE
jgi:preprotein translocase subunit SecG